MLWLGPLWQDIARSHPPDERPLPGLADTEVPSIEHSKAYLHWLPPCDQMCCDGVSIAHNANWACHH